MNIQLVAIISYKSNIFRLPNCYEIYICEFDGLIFITHRV
jgi:hypothetical protein